MVVGADRTICDPNSPVQAAVRHPPAVSRRPMAASSITATSSPAAHAAGALAVVAADLLALTLIKPPASSARISPSARRNASACRWASAARTRRYMATKTEYARKMPGRIVGVSKDAQGNPAYRLALQTREQHIRREKATSNICTAQVLLAIMAGMYARLSRARRA